MGNCKQCKGRLEEDFISDYLTMSVDQRPCALCRGTGVIRTGPYRLADGTWSDGVNRSVSIRRQPIRDRIKVSLSPWSGEWQVHNKLPRSTGRFSTWEAAVTYADHLSRTNQGENK